MKEKDSSMKRRLLLRQKSRSLNNREENRFVNSIVQEEICMPDDVLVSTLFQDFKFMEFLSALMTLIGNSLLMKLYFLASVIMRQKLNLVYILSSIAKLDWQMAYLLQF
jgi:hypothetical protein